MAAPRLPVPPATRQQQTCFVSTPHGEVMEDGALNGGRREEGGREESAREEWLKVYQACPFLEAEKRATWFALPTV